MWKGTISFGLVSIPVKLYTATESKDIRFNLLHRECRSPVQYRKWCSRCDREIKADEIIRGYELDAGRYVTVSDEELEAIPIAAKRTVEIIGFIRLAEVDPIYFDKTYFLEPAEGGAKPYALLRKAMAQTGHVAVARVVIRSKESLVAIRVYGDRVLALETMHYPDEVRSTAELTGIAEPELRPLELEMAAGLIQTLQMTFQPEQFQNQYREAVRQLIEAKAAGEPVVQAEEAPDRGKVIDLMEALRASIQAVQAAKPAQAGQAGHAAQAAQAAQAGQGVQGAQPAQGSPVPPPAQPLPDPEAIRAAQATQPGMDGAAMERG